MPRSKVRKKRGRPHVAPQRPAGMGWDRFPWRGIDAQLPLLAFPADLLGVDAPEHAQLVVDLVVGSQEHERHRVTLNLSRRLRLGSHVKLWGSDAENLLTVHLSATGEGHCSFTARVTADRLTGQQAQRLLDLMTVFASPNMIALTLPSQPVAEWSPITGVTVPAPPPGLAEVVAAHAAIERAMGIERPLPHTYKARDVTSTLDTARLLAGHDVTARWSRLSWPLPLHEAHTLVSNVFHDDGPAEVEVDAPWSWTLGGGGEVEVGLVVARYAPVRLELPTLPALTDRNRDESVTLQLVPADADAVVTYRLVQVADTGTSRLARPADQRWFWAPEWQAREHEVDEHLMGGHVTTHDSADDFTAHLDRLASQG